MSEHIINIGGHGLGDCLLSLQISYHLKRNNIPHTNLISTRDDVFNPLNFIFGEEFIPIQINESYANDNALLKDKNLLEDILDKYGQNNSEITYNLPDLLYCNEYALDYKRFNLEPFIIKQTRIGLSSVSERKNIIYCGLCSTTDGYIYENIPLLLVRLAEFLPNYQIYFPLIKKWDKEINNLGNFNITFPDNVIIDDNPSFIESLKILKQSCFGVFTCNGPSHIAYQLGIPRLILDPQFYRLPWMSRWKEDYDDCINIYTDFNHIARLVYNNITYPQTKMIDSKIILEILQNNPTINWGEALLFKNK